MREISPDDADRILQAAAAGRSVEGHEGLSDLLLGLHSPEVPARWPDLPHDRLMQEMCLVDVRGNRHWGPEAFRHLTRRLRRLWWAAPLMHLPGAMLVARPAYRWVSRNRYLIAGKAECDSDACSLHR